jgi:hypothetical protein
MPNPVKGESLQHFVSKYMGSSHAQKSFPSQKQRAAVAYSEFRRKKKRA